MVNGSSIERNLDSLFTMELVACNRAIQWAKECNLLQICIWTDSKLLVDAWSISTIIADIKMASRSFDYLCICKVR